MKDNVMKQFRAVTVVTLVFVMVMSMFTGEQVFAKAKKLAKPGKPKCIVRYAGSDYGMRTAKGIIKWKKVKGADGYQLRVRFQGLGDWGKWHTVTRKRNVYNLEESGANCGYVMRIRVRAYRIKKNGKRKYSKWTRTRYIDVCSAYRDVITYNKSISIR